jgi:hypothetical protein
MRLFTIILLASVLLIETLGGSAKILPSVSITTSSLPVAVESKPYRFQLTATGCRGPCVWRISGLPNGLVASYSGLIQGTPIVSGKFVVTVSVR